MEDSAESDKGIDYSKKDNILVFCAHPDDEVFGVGGTIAMYKAQGIPAVAVIFSYGEDSHPWLDKKFTVKTRVKESKSAGELIGYSESIFLGLPANELSEMIKKRKVEWKVKSLISKYQPTKIFMHSAQDPHPAHKAVNKAVRNALSSLRYKCDVYGFNIWGQFNPLSKKTPKLVVDISKTFSIKTKALAKFKSQKMSLISLLPHVYMTALINGFNYDVKYAEVFEKVR